jgi:hypothetical protein
METDKDLLRSPSSDRLVLIGLVAAQDALRTDPVIHLVLEAPSGAQCHCLQFGRQSDQTLGAVGPQQMTPPTHNEPGHIRHT